MAAIIITFNFPINASVQVGDTIYYTNDLNGVELVLIGNILDIPSESQIAVEISESTIRPTTSSFILFSKNNETNINALTGYYAEVQLRNDSTNMAEMYSVASEVFVSSE